MDPTYRQFQSRQIAWLSQLSTRLARLLVTEGVLTQDTENSYLTLDHLEVEPMQQVHGHSITYRIQILLQFLFEALLLCLLGGFVGLVIGYGIGAGVAAAIPDFPDAVVPFWAVLLAVGFSAGVGLIFGIAPAAKAANLDPIEALRYE